MSHDPVLWIGAAIVGLQIVQIALALHLGWHVRRPRPLHGRVK